MAIAQRNKEEEALKQTKDELLQLNTQIKTVELGHRIEAQQEEILKASQAFQERCVALERLQVSTQEKKEELLAEMREAEKRSATITREHSLLERPIRRSLERAQSELETTRIAWKAYWPESFLQGVEITTQTTSEEYRTRLAALKRAFPTTERLKPEVIPTLEELFRALEQQVTKQSASQEVKRDQKIELLWNQLITTIEATIETAPQNEHSSLLRELEKAQEEKKFHQLAQSFQKPPSHLPPISTHSPSVLVNTQEELYSHGGAYALHLDDILFEEEEISIDYNGRTTSEGKKIKFYHFFSVIFYMFIERFKN